MKRKYDKRVRERKKDRCRKRRLKTKNACFLNLLDNLSALKRRYYAPGSFFFRLNPVDPGRSHFLELVHFNLRKMSLGVKIFCLKSENKMLSLK